METKIDKSDLMAVVLTAIDDAVDERICGLEGDVVHTDWTEEDWENYKEENCEIKNHEDYLRFGDRVYNSPNVWCGSKDLVEFCEITKLVMDVLLRKEG